MERAERAPPRSSCGPFAFEPGFTRHAEGSVLAEFGATRVLCTASVEEGVPPVPARAGPGLDHRRVRHAAARDAHPHGAGGGPGQADGPHPGDPAPDRPGAARHGGSQGARRAHGDARLRRAAGGRRHPHRRDLRRLGGAGAGGRIPGAGWRPQAQSAARAGGGGVRRHLSRQRRSSTSTTPRTARRRPT